MQFRIFANSTEGPRQHGFFLKPGRYRFSLSRRKGYDELEAWEYTNKVQRWKNNFKLFSAGNMATVTFFGTGKNYHSAAEAFDDYTPVDFEVVGENGWPMLAYISDNPDKDNRGGLTISIENVA